MNAVKDFLRYVGKQLGRPRKRPLGTTPFAIFLREFRARTGLSTVQIAEICGSSDKTVRAWESGEGPEDYMVSILKEWLEWKVTGQAPEKITIPAASDGLSKKHRALLELVYQDVRKLLVLKVKQTREHDWNVLMAVLNRLPSGSGGVVEGRP